MKWSLRPTAKNADLLAKWREEGHVKKASTLDDKPVLFKSNEWLWEKFSVLSMARENGFNGPNPIKISELFFLCQMLQITDPRDREELLRIIPHIDNIFLDDYYSRQKRESKQKNKGNN